MSEEDIEDDINSRNFKHFNNGGKVLHMYNNKRNKTSTVFMEVTPEIYKYLRENNNRIFIGHECCRVYDLINITPCFNCGRYGHNASKCRNDSVCLKCAEKHKVVECKNTKVECINCVFNNIKYRTNLTTNHLATDRINCTILKNKIKKIINSTDYPIAPSLPTWDDTSLLYQRKTNTVKNITLKLQHKTTKQKMMETGADTAKTK